MPPTAGSTGTRPGDGAWAPARALTALFEPDQVNFAFLMNVDAHVHLHVIPRYATHRHWHGLDLEDPHWGDAFGSEQRVLDESALSALAFQVRYTLRSAS